MLIRKQLYRIRRKLTLAKKRPGEIFEEIYANNNWGDKESVSGPGSRLDRTDKIRLGLPSLLTKYGCQSLLDIPCGDFNWMKTLDLSTIDYVGGDIVPEIIINNQEQYANDHQRFVLLDVLKDPLPRVDLILCRDCLVHFSNRDIRTAIKNIKASGSKYLLATTFTEREKNPNIVTGEWRPVNMTITPFNLHEPLVYVDDSYESKNYFDKKMGLWIIANLPDFQ